MGRLILSNIRALQCDLHLRLKQSLDDNYGFFNDPLMLHLAEMVTESFTVSDEVELDWYGGNVYVHVGGDFPERRIHLRGDWALAPPKGLVEALEIAKP